MAKRIRYVKTGNLLRSFRVFITPSGGYLLELNPSTKTAYLLDIDTNSVVKQTSVNGNLHKLKIEARKLLEEVGVATQQESRKKRKVLESVAETSGT